MIKQQAEEEKKNEAGPVRESNPGPLAPKARIMPLDQQASHKLHEVNYTTNTFVIFVVSFHIVNLTVTTVNLHLESLLSKYHSLEKSTKDDHMLI